MQDLNGKRVVITGGSQGLGLAIVEALAACGVNVTAIGAIVGSAVLGGVGRNPGEGEHVSCVTQLTKENRNGSDGSEFPNNSHRFVSISEIVFMVQGSAGRNGVPRLHLTPDPGPDKPKEK
jgi:NAD(P)-dependent dehydrogenase (short-subunit alcohol dehydrogenase family)